MSISGLSSDTTISQTKFYLDEVRKIAGEASSTPTTASTSAISESKAATQTVNAVAGSEADSYNVYIKSDLSNVTGYAPGLTTAAQPASSTQPAAQLSGPVVKAPGTNSTPASGSAGPVPSVSSQSGSVASAPGTISTQIGSTKTADSQAADASQNTGSSQDKTSVQDGDSDDAHAYSVLVNDLTMLASFIQSGNMPNAKTTAGTVMKDLSNYLSAPSQNQASANPPTPKFVVQNFGSLLASVQEGDKASASTIVSALKVLT